MLVRQSTAGTVTVGPILDADGVFKTDEVVGSIRLSKNGGAAAVPNASATLTHSHTGMYLLAMTAADRDTLGGLEITLNSGTNAMPPRGLNVITQDAYDALHHASNGSLRASGNWNVGKEGYELTAAYDLAKTASQFDASADPAITDNASREASKATGFATPANVTDAAAAIILQGNAEWATATTVVASNMLTTSAIASQVRTELGVELARIDETISSRSTYAGADTAGTTTLLARVVGTIAAGTHNPQTGDAFARIGANGAGLTALATSVAIAAAMVEIEKVPRTGTTHTWTNTDTNVAATVAITEAGP